MGLRSGQINDMVLKLESIVEDILGRECLQGRVETRLGWICCKNTDFRLGPRWLVSFNYPTKVDEIEYISQYIRSAHRETVHRFYRSCNGMKILGNRFSVPGVRMISEKNSENDFVNIPYGFDVMGGISLPPQSPTDGFLIGVSHIEDSSGDGEKLYDILDSKGTIVSGFFDDADGVTESFHDVESWLKMRVEGARRRFLKARLARMN